MARPTKYTPEILQKARTYIKTNERAVATHIGLAYLLEISNSTMYKWAGEEGKEEFSDILDRIMQLQYLELTDGSLKGDLHGGISKLMLTKHGLSDKVDNISSDGTMSSPTVIQLVAKEFGDL